MSYTIKNTDGTILTLLADGKVDQYSSSITLIGKNVNGFGEYLNNNFIKLLENFANTAGSPPSNPLTGQIWYDTTSKKLKIYDNGFKSISGVIMPDTAGSPDDLVKGDLWYDSINGQIKMYYQGGQSVIVGPLYSSLVGTNGLVPVSVKDIYDVSYTINIIYNYGKPIGVVSDDDFYLSSSDSLAYFNSPPFYVSTGLTVKGDVSFSGKSEYKNLTCFIDIDTLSSTISGVGSDVGTNAAFNEQNNAISIILKDMFPIATQFGGVTYYGYTNINEFSSAETAPYDDYTSRTETGVPVGSICKVLCKYSGSTGTNPNSGGSTAGSGYQVRRFRAENVSGTLSWNPLNHTEISIQF